MRITKTGTLFALLLVGALAQFQAWPAASPPATTPKPTPGVDFQTPTAVNPTGTTSTASLKMMGMGSAAHFTVGSSGRVLMGVTGNLGNTTAADGTQAYMVYGTGGTAGAPANGAALTGTTSPSACLAGKGDGYPCHNTWLITGLTPGADLWVDVALICLAGGTCSIGNASFTITNLPTQQ